MSAPTCTLEVGDRERDDQVVHDVLGEPQPHRGEHAARITLQHLEHAVRHGLDPLDLLLCRNEDRRIGHLGPDVVADQHHHGRQPERDPPSPGQERRVRQRSGQHQAARPWRACCRRALRPAASSPRMRARDSGLCSATSSTAPPHSPPTAKPCMKRRTTSSTGAQIADLPVRRQAAHQEGDGADEQQAELQELLAAVLVAEVPEHHAAERTRDEADRVGEQRREDRAVVACRSRRRTPC